MTLDAFPRMPSPGREANPVREATELIVNPKDEEETTESSDELVGAVDGVVDGADDASSDALDDVGGEVELTDANDANVLSRGCSWKPFPNLSLRL